MTHAMPVCRFTQDTINRVPKAADAERGVQAWADLRRLLRANIGVVARPPSDVLVISEEFGGTPGYRVPASDG